LCGVLFIQKHEKREYHRSNPGPPIGTSGGCYTCTKISRAMSLAESDKEEKQPINPECTTASAGIHFISSPQRKRGSSFSAGVTEQNYNYYERHLHCRGILLYLNRIEKYFIHLPV